MTTECEVRPPNSIGARGGVGVQTKPIVARGGAGLQTKPIGARGRAGVQTKPIRTRVLEWGEQEPSSTGVYAQTNPIRGGGGAGVQTRKSELMKIVSSHSSVKLVPAIPSVTRHIYLKQQDHKQELTGNEVNIYMN